MSYGDGNETYLEAFIESLTTLPHEVKRNLEMIKDLDKSGSAKTDELINLQQQYLRQAQQKLSKVRVVENYDGKILGMQLIMNKEEQAKKNKNSSLTSSPTEEGEEGQEEEEAFIPTTEELFDYTYNSQLYHQIQTLQQDCLQKADEKVMIAQQAYDTINVKVQRLDHDLMIMEKLLQASGEFDLGLSVRPNDLAACQVSPGSEWILAKVTHHDPKTGMYKLADEDVESDKIFDLPESQVIVLSTVEKLRSGDIVYAVYPDTTSFYQATVVQAPRKQGGGTSGGGGPGAFVMLNFHDDADEFGVTHDKAVPLKHVMFPP